MQAIKDKISDMSAMRKIKAETKAEEQVEKEMAKARVEVAHELRLAKEAEAAKKMHVQKAGEKAHKALVNNPHTQDGAVLGSGSGQSEGLCHGGSRSLNSHGHGHSSSDNETSLGGLRSASMDSKERPTSGMGTPNKSETNPVAPSTH